jgi:ABC-type amino acid transport substrate-binding protein/ABC-type amino acid transport system permease subunit
MSGRGYNVLHQLAVRCGACLVTALAACGATAQARPIEALPAPGFAAPITGKCAPHLDSLQRVLCTGELRLGVRTKYAPFADQVNGQAQGFEIDLGAALAARLGVRPRYVLVTPANRIASLGEGRTDAVIATMGDTVQRDAEVLFVRPHYYQSETIVLGRSDLDLPSIEAVSGKTVCVAVGNNTNAELASHGARLMLFDNASQLVDQLRQGACSFAAQDNTFFAAYLTEPDFGARYQVKFSFASLPWGIGVDLQHGHALAQALGLAVQEMHASGQLVGLARAHGIDASFLRQQQLLFASGPCAAPGAIHEPTCLQKPHDNQLAATSFAPSVSAFEAWCLEHLHIKVTLAMLKTRIALEFFMEGVAFSLALVGGAIASTWTMALVFGAGLSSPQRWRRWPARLVLMVMQSTPLVLLMVFAEVLISAVGTNTSFTALAGAIVVLGLFNGSNAGQAVAEAHASLWAERGLDRQRPTLRQAMLQAKAQLLAFVVNATRGSPAASIIGVPELLSAQTDITSFASERATTYTLLLLFYMLVVSFVVWMGKRIERRLHAREGQHA